MNFLEMYEDLSKKKRITKMDKCRFLATMPDVVLSMTGSQCIRSLPDAKAIAAFYSDDDVEELFDYWFGFVKGFREDREEVWK